MQKPKILLIDSETDYLNNLKERLRARFQVQTATAFSQARSLIRRKSFDLIVTEILLEPELAFELFADIRNKLYRPTMIVVTHHATKEIAIECLNLGVQRFFEKPICPDKLATEISSCLKADFETITKNEVEIAPGVILNFQLQRIFQNESEVSLTGTEFEIIKTLWARRNQKILRKEIIERIWADRNISENNLDTQFSNLKKKVPAIRDRLVVVRGKGYIYRNF